MTAPDQNPESPTPASGDDEGQDRLPGIISDKYNTVFERIMSRLSGENSVHPVVACVAYGLYKQEKREWIMQRQADLGRRPRADEIDAYVSGCTDLRIESFFTQARDLIRDHAANILESSKEEMRDEVYRRQFQGLHDNINGGLDLIKSNHDDVKSHISAKTAPAWGTSLSQNLVANFIWTFVVVTLLVSLNLGFDFNNFSSRVKAFFSPPAASSDTKTQ